MIQFKHLSKGDLVGDGNLKFRRYGVVDERFLAWCRGEITELLPEDFGDVTELPDYTLWSTFVTSYGPDRLPTSNLKRVILPDNVSKIGKNSFLLPGDGVEVIFPAAIQTIGQQSFTGIYTIYNVHLIADFSKAKRVPALSIDDTNTGASYSFSSDANTVKTIKVPATLWDEWIAADGWKYLYTRGNTIFEKVGE